MQQIIKYFSRKNKVENKIVDVKNELSSEPLEVENFVRNGMFSVVKDGAVGGKLTDDVANAKSSDSLFLLPSIKNNIGNFRKLTHLEITYIEEMLNIKELIELIKVYDDCVSMIVDTKSFKSQLMYVKG